MYIARYGRHWPDIAVGFIEGELDIDLCLAILSIRKQGGEVPVRVRPCSHQEQQTIY